MKSAELSLLPVEKVAAGFVVVPAAYVFEKVALRTVFSLLRHHPLACLGLAVVAGVVWAFHGQRDPRDPKGKKRL